MSEVAMTSNAGCPEGMYATGTEEVTFPGTARDFADLRGQVEPMLGPLNVPIGWWFSDPEGDNFDPEVDERHFEFVVWMPRKMKTWSVRITEFDRNEVQRWLDTTVHTAVMEWFGWKR